VTHLLPHHRYVCTRHRYWIGPPDIDQPTTALGGLDDIVRAQRHHLRLVHRHGPSATYDAVLTGFLFCGHLWAERRADGVGVHREWTRRAEVLIPPGTETATFSASRLFAAVYPQAVRLAGLIASPTWRHRAAGDADQQRQFITEVGRRLDRPHHPGDGGDAVAHWMMFDCWRPPSRPDRTFPTPASTAQFTHRRSVQTAETGTIAAHNGLPARAAAEAPSCTTATSGQS
jgi:hypothetical protein